jgi:PAS domain S-box-containing protein
MPRLRNLLTQRLNRCRDNTRFQSIAPAGHKGVRNQGNPIFSARGSPLNTAYLFIGKQAQGTVYTHQWKAPGKSWTERGPNILAEGEEMKYNIAPTGKEIVVNEQDFIVSKSDPKGNIVYANRQFMQISGYREDELLGRQHNIVRHPDMPRGLFYLLWQKISRGQECFAYIKNLCKNGDHYWVLANVTPDYDAQGSVIGYFSVRRSPRKEALSYFSALYQDMHAVERRSGPQSAVIASSQVLEKAILDKGYDNYETFVLGC